MTISDTYTDDNYRLVKYSESYSSNAKQSKLIKDIRSGDIFHLIDCTNDSLIPIP